MHTTPSPPPTRLYSALQAAAWGGGDDGDTSFTLDDVDDDEWRVGEGRCSSFFSEEHCQEVKANYTAVTGQVARNLGTAGGVTVFLVCLFACCMKYLHSKDDGSSVFAYSTASQV